jgi:hypothetical protein
MDEFTYVAHDLLTSDEVRRDHDAARAAEAQAWATLAVAYAISGLTRAVEALAGQGQSSV